MSGKLMAKLRATAGETLVETLAAILVSVLAVTAMTTAVVTSSNFNQQATRHATEARVQQGFAAAGNGYGSAASDIGGYSDGTVAIADFADPSAVEQFSGSRVVVHGGDDIVSYELEVD